jgi:hypothetical protein
VISRFLRYTFFDANAFLAKLWFLAMLPISLTVLFAGCTGQQTGHPTGFTVTSLHPGQAIQNSPIEVEGTYGSIGSGLVWIVLGDDYGNYYLQSPPVQFGDDGKWTAKNVRPLHGITAVNFVSVTSDGNKTFQSKVSAQEFGAFSKLPDGSMILQSIPITSQVSA